MFPSKRDINSFVFSILEFKTKPLPSHYFVQYYFVLSLISLSLDLSSDTFAPSDCWKIQRILILPQRSAAGKRKRKIRTETGEKINVFGGVFVTRKKF